MDSKKSRAPRAKLPSQLPLDDGARGGTEIWRELDGAELCRWDRWLGRRW